MAPGAIILRCTAGLLVLTGVVVYEAGAIRVEVFEKSRGGHHIWLAVPAALLPIGVKLAPKQTLRDATRELRPWLPAIRAASKELERCPDGPLVEVDDRKEQVRIAKRGGALYIDVDSDTETVHVSFPLGVVAYTAGQLVTEGPPV